PRPLPRQGLAEGSTSYVALSEPDVHGQPEATPVLDELVIVVGDRLVEQVIDTRAQHYVLVYVIRAAQIHEGIRRRHKRLARRRRGGGVAFLAAELQARPQIQVRRRLPIQADVEHVLGPLVQRLPCVLARFLLRVRVGVCRVQGDGLGQGRRQAGFYATRNGVVHVGIGGGRAAKAVRGPAFRARHASDLVFELVVKQRQAGL